MGKVAALVLTEEENTQDFAPSRLVPLSENAVAIPLPPTFVGTFPSGEGFWVPQKTNELPTARLCPRAIDNRPYQYGGKWGTYATTRLPTSDKNYAGYS